MIKKIKLPVSIPVYIGHDGPGLARRQALFNEAGRRGISMSKLVWALITRAAEGQFAKELHGIEK